jgi:hypothetical protein
VGSSSVALRFTSAAFWRSNTFVTPARQLPLGVTMSLRRRLAL